MTESRMPSENRREGDLELASWPDVDRRVNSDRRDRPTTFWDALVGKGRRQRGRRLGETQNIYVEVYGRAEIILVTVVLTLNILDAFLTLDYLNKGGEEANPVAQGLLDLGDEWFLAAKSILVGCCLLFLMVHKTFSYVRQALWTLTLFYGALLVYHIVLQARYHFHT